MRLSDVTLVVPTKNEAHNIDRFLDALPGDLELVVIDASTDATAQRIAARRPTARIVAQTGTIARARQCGAELARTRWLLFTDADVEFAPNYFAELRRVRDADVVFGPKLSRSGYERHYERVRLAQRYLARAGIPAATGSNLLVRAEALAAVGGFDVALPCNEDSEVVWRIKAAGWRMRFDENLCVFAFDHRRLERGSAYKSWHSAVRCLLLYTQLMPRRLRSHDWGYWSTPRIPLGDRDGTP